MTNRRNHRLRSGRRKLDNGETAIAECERSFMIGKVCACIRTSMAQCVGHCNRHSGRLSRRYDAAAYCGRRSRLLTVAFTTAERIYRGLVGYAGLNDSVYLFSRHAIKPGDLRPAHAVSRQCAHAAHVGGWYYTGVLPGRLFPPFLLLIGRHLCFRTRHRRG